MTTHLSLESASRNDRLADEIARLSNVFEASGDVGSLVRLRDYRISAGAGIGPATVTAFEHGPREAPPNLVEIGPDGLPEVDLRDLTSERLESAMHHHGALNVRNFFSPRLAFDFRRDIDEVLEEAKTVAETDAPDGKPERNTREKATYMPVPAEAGLDNVKERYFNAISGAILTFLSPRVSQKLLAAFERLGLRGLLQDYFGDEPCLSFSKSVLRRAEPLKNPADWHQDGAFMGPGIQSLNVWVALTECGGGTDSPGMDLLPKRFHSVIPSGKNGAGFSWSISQDTVASEYAHITPARPYFAAGDAVLFDHFNLHATSWGPEYTQVRYAIETWFFSKSRCALNQNPVYW